MEKSTILNRKILLFFEYGLVVLPPFLPLFFDFPYRINVFVAWEGAYRIAEGQIPFSDFGIPVGFVFWIIPAVFFKLFGYGVYTLIKTQVFINLISNYSFRGIFKTLGVFPEVRIIGLLVFNLSFTLVNFWPWYNHMVFVLELVAIFILLLAILDQNKVKKFLKIGLSAFFAFLTLFTKQDTGGFTIILALSILIISFFYQRNYILIGLFLATYLALILVLIFILRETEFNYWFNYGQFPHNSRLSFFDLLDEFLGASKWLKFYLLIWFTIVVYVISSAAWNKIGLKDLMIFFITFFIFFQASVIQVTSYTPIDGNIYFHSFAVVFIGYFITSRISMNSLTFVTVILFMSLWWSNVFWTRFFINRFKQMFPVSRTEKSISKNTFIKPDTTSALMNRSDWRLSNFKSFRNIKLPYETIEGIKRLKRISDSLYVHSKPKLLNMSELTPLIIELPYQTETGVNFPLWYHKGVSFFDREVSFFCDKINNQEYDIILFEDIPDLNNFYPYEVRECIQKHYDLRYRFLAPRIPEFCYIEVYLRER